MTALSPTLAGASHVLGWTLIHFIWQGTLLAVLLALALVVVPRRLARARYAAGCATVAMMLAAPLWTLWQLATWGTPDIGPVTPWPGSLATTWTTSASTAVPLTTQQVMPWLAALWSLGVIVCLARHAGGFWQAQRMVRVGTRPAPAALQGMKEELVAKLRLRRPVMLLESVRVQVPVVVGFLRPVVLVPASALSGLTPPLVEAVLAHELAHVRRHDYFVNLIQTAIETLLFYHPAVWWVSHTVRVEREHCCDDIAVAVCGDRVLYARALTAVEAVRHDATAAALAVSGTSLSARVRRLLGAPPPARVSSSGYIVAALTAIMVSGAGTFSWIDGALDFGGAGASTSNRALVSGSVAEAAVTAIETDDVALTSRPRHDDTRPAAAAQQPEPPPVAEDRDDDDSQSDSNELQSNDESRAHLADARRALRQAQASVRAAVSRQMEAAAAVRRAAQEARQSGLASEARELQREAQALSREATRHAREVLHTAQRAMREAARFARESQRLQRQLQRELRPGTRPVAPKPARPVSPAAPPQSPSLPKPPPPPPPDKAAAVPATPRPVTPPAPPSSPPPPPLPAEAPAAPEAELPEPPAPASSPEPPLPPQESHRPRLPSPERAVMPAAMLELPRVPVVIAPADGAVEVDCGDARNQDVRLRAVTRLRFRPLGER